MNLTCSKLEVDSSVRDEVAESLYDPTRFQREGSLAQRPTGYGYRMSATAILPAFMRAWTARIFLAIAGGTPRSGASLMLPFATVPTYRRAPSFLFENRFPIRP